MAVHCSLLNSNKVGGLSLSVSGARSAAAAHSGAVSTHARPKWIIIQNLDNIKILYNWFDLF